MRELTNGQEEIYVNWRLFVENLTNKVKHMSDEQLLYFFKKSRDACILTDDSLAEESEICITYDFCGIGMALFFPLTNPENKEIIDEIINLRRNLFGKLCREVADRGLLGENFGKF